MTDRLLDMGRMAAQEGKMEAFTVLRKLSPIDPVPPETKIPQEVAWKAPAR